MGFSTIFRMHYNVMLMEMDVDGAPLDLPPSIVRKGGTIIDSGTTLGYLPQALYDSLIETVISLLVEILISSLCIITRIFLLCRLLLDNL